MMLLLTLLFLSNLIFGAPSKIISLGPVITEQLYLLGVGNKIVGCTIYCNKPEEAKKIEKVGTVVEINVEKIFSLSPDLVIATSLTNPKQIKKLKNLGLKVEVFKYAKSFSQLCEDFIKLGKIVGEGKKAREIIENVKPKIEHIKKKTKGLRKPKVIVILGTKPLWVATKDSFINDFIEFAGGINLGPVQSGLVSREEIIKQNPDVIIITEMGLSGEREKKNWKKYNTISAVKNNRIYIVDSNQLCSPTPVSFVETLKMLVYIFHSLKCE